MKIVNPILKVSEACNFDCQFCHYADGTYASKHNYMSLDICKYIIKEAIKFNLQNGYNEMSITFHGGEPLMRGKDFFRDILEYLNYLSDKYQIKIKNYIQTNGYLLDEEWAILFQENNFDVGISIDGPESMNYHTLRSQSNKKIIKKIIDNYHLLKTKGVYVGIISVITDTHFNNHKEFYEFIKNNKIDSIGLNFCYNKETNYSIDNYRLSIFLEELFNLYIENEYTLDIREFNGALLSCAGLVNHQCTSNYRKSCGSFLTFNAKGDVFFCDYIYRQNSNLGNIEEQSLADIITGEKYLEEKIRCNKKLNSCQKCKVFSICKGGCYREDFEKNSEISNYFCIAKKNYLTYINEFYENTLKKVSEDENR